MTLKKELNNEDKIIRMPDLDYTPDRRGVGYVFYDCMKKFKNNIAQIDGITGEKENYESLLQKCIRTAIKIRSMGITSEDIVTLCTFNHINSCVPYIAGLFLGAKVSALDPTLSLQDTIVLLKRVPSKIIFAGLESVEMIEAAIADIKMDIKIIVFGPSDKYESFDKFLEPNKEEKDFVPRSPKDLKETALIIYSSGTTGLPKGICIHHYGFLCQIKNNCDFEFREDIYLTFASLYWVSVISSLGTTIFTGCARLLVPKFSPTVIWNAIHKFRPTIILGVPFNFASLQKNRNKDIDTSSLVHVLVGGTALIESQILAVRKMFPSATVFTGYGQTEMAFVVTIFKASNKRDVEFVKTKPTSCGTGVRGVWYKVVDVETEEVLGPNEPGELRLKTEFHTSGYYNMDSPDLLDKDGWYRTGDFVYYDEDKCFYVVDRLKEFLKYQMWHVSPCVLETILTQHPEISNSLVIGIPHEVDVNHLMALVVLKNKNSKISPKEIQKYVEDRVDERKRLVGGVKIVDAIPLGATGKVKRREVRDMVLRGEL